MVSIEQQSLLASPSILLIFYLVKRMLDEIGRKTYFQMHYQFHFFVQTIGKKQKTK